MSEINVKIDAFEGPLDLLLHLIQRMELDIYDIPIAEVTSQYLVYIKTMKVLKLDVAGDYLIMAATLMAIKSHLLLPKQELTFDDETLDYFEGGQDPRESLVEQLIEYRKYKKAAEPMQYLGPHRLYLHSLLPHRQVLLLIFSGSYHADTVRLQWISDLFLPVPLTGPESFLQWMRHFFVPHQNSEILLLLICLQNIRMLLLHLRSHNEP